MTRWVGTLIVVSAVFLVGCGKKGLGPIDPKDVKAADQTQVKKQMDESAKHLPPGVKMPKGAGGPPK